MTAEATASTNNGSRPWITVPDYEGPAGFVQNGETAAQLAFAPGRRTGSALGMFLQIEGQSWRVTGQQSSQWVEGMTILTLVADSPPEGS